MDVHSHTPLVAMPSWPTQPDNFRKLDKTLYVYNLFQNCEITRLSCEMTGFEICCIDKQIMQDSITYNDTCIWNPWVDRKRPVRSSSDVKLFMFRTWSLQLSTWRDRCLKLTLTCLIWIDPWIKIKWPTWEFWLWSSFVSNVELLMCRT